MNKTNKIECNRLVTFTIYARLFPRKKGNIRGVPVSYLYKLKGERTSEKNRKHFTLIEISGVKFIYLNDYALSLLNLTFEETRELIKTELAKDKEERTKDNIKNKLASQNQLANKQTNKPEQSKDEEFFIE